MGLWCSGNTLACHARTAGSNPASPAFHQGSLVIKPEPNYREIIMQSTRSLSVQETGDAYLIRSRGASSKPAIRLTGSWLVAAGFPAGSRVTIRVNHGSLVITPEPTAKIG